MTDTNSKLVIGTLSDRYCGKLKDGDTIFMGNAKLCRLFNGHKGEHCWGDLYS